MTRLIPFVVIIGLIAGCSNGSEGGGSTTTAPTAPTSPPATRVVELVGDLNLGDVTIGTTADKVIRVLNRGTAQLTITGMTGPSGFKQLLAVRNVCGKRMT